MTRARGISLAVSAVAAEAAAALVLVAGPTAVGVVLAVLLHGLAALLTVRWLNGTAGALALPPVTPLAAVAALFLPVMGPLGLALLLRSVGRAARAGSDGPPPVITRLPDLPATAPEPAALAGAGDVTGGGPAAASADDFSHLGAGALVARLRFARDPAMRVKAVLATRRLEGARATPLLREALRDRHEDVRLLAYALLEDRERLGDATIRGLMAALAVAPEARRASLHDQLAHAYWELCYQGLVAGELESFSLARALEHLDVAAVDAARGAARWLLRARVLLRQGDATAARAALQESWRRGMPARTIEPYVAETFFIQRMATGVAP